jgi:pyruvate dehydrogenase E1 component alpha subunit
MDVVAVHEGVRAAVSEARKYKATFVELDTYRFRGHSMSDPVHSVYRSKEEVERQKEKDPITILAQALEASGIFSAEDLKALDKEVSVEIKSAMESALRSPEPDPSTVYDYVYRQDPYASARVPDA